MMLEVLGIQLVQELKPELLSENYNLGWQLNLELTLEEKRNLQGFILRYTLESAIYELANNLLSYTLILTSCKRFVPCLLKRKKKKIDIKKIY